MTSNIIKDAPVFEETAGQRGLPSFFDTVFTVARRAVIGTLELQLPDGRVFRAKGEEPGPAGRVVIHNARALRRMTFGGATGFAESYIDGDWSTPDLQAVLDMAILNNERIARGFRVGSLRSAIDRAQHWLRRNSKRQAQRNIAAHYDLGNDFYAQWLDSSMTYSAALFDQPGLTLEQAQRRKYSSLCDRMALKPGHRVLEIGCGWGGFACYAAVERGAKVKALTISKAQYEAACKKVFEAGLVDQVEIELRDYRDETGVFDRIASIEMFEAVGEAYWSTYFDNIRERLDDNGIAALQIITIDDPLFDRYRRSVDFIQKYIFPGGMLPSLSRLKSEIKSADLTWIDHISFGQSYSRTLRLWLEQFDCVWQDITELEAEQPFDARFQRLWRFYLAVCAACFRAGTTDVIQVSLARR